MSEEEIRIKDISDYIGAISKIMSRNHNDFVTVFRGENRIFPEPCKPNIFRGGYLEKNKCYEKNLFDEMTANKLTQGSSYLEKAIDAQHGGFPSRLLDVTYNCLVALYFAVTPSPNEKEYTYDIESTNGISNDGRVFIFNIEKMFCPSGDEINEMYNAIVERKENCFLLNEIFQVNHKFIDHIKLNNRIIAQQGALILFQGEKASSMPKYCYKDLIIPAKCKAQIRKELKNLFGIHTGSIYPESNNLVKYISNKVQNISNRKFDYKNELELVMYNFKNEMDLNYEKFVNKAYEKRDLSGERDVPKEMLKEVMILEEYIFSYRDAFISERDSIKRKISMNEEKIENRVRDIEETIKDYNEYIEEFCSGLQSHLKKYAIEFTGRDLKIEIGDRDE